jgi:hypothetical protein
MGRGKTSTITPMIIIDSYMSYYNYIKQYNIILPEHLVNSSFDIIVKFS